MIEANIYLPNTAATLRLGACLSAKPLPPVIALDGDLGAGKTHLAQGLAAALGLSERLTSPTFTLVNVYEAPPLTLFHFDWYRLGSLDELYDLGWDDYLATPHSLCLVEWAARFPQALPAETLSLHLAHERPGRRAHLRIPEAYAMLGTLIAQEFALDG
jgi:tRNA threonylcarbamoyladenosine biosynthesis protein TsaE